MSITFGHHQGNRSEYLAMFALTKMGFIVPVPRQEDHFGVDFIVHLSELNNLAIRPTGRSFGIQIKSNDTVIEIDNEDKRNYLYNSTLPFFIGIISRDSLILKIYSTINRLRFYYMSNPGQNFRFIFDGQGDSMPKPDYDNGNLLVGKPIIEVDISEQSEPHERLQEREMLHTVMKSWVELENQAISLKEQNIRLLYWPSNYQANMPLAEIEHLSHDVYADLQSLPNICKATERTLTSLIFYADKINTTSDENDTPTLLELIRKDANLVKNNCHSLRCALSQQEDRSSDNSDVV